MNCKKCSIEYLNITIKSQASHGLCLECMREYERERRKKLRIKWGLSERTCPQCEIKHQSPGYCKYYCLSCFRKLESTRKAKWRQENIDIDKARLDRYYYRDHEKSKKRLRKSALKSRNKNMTKFKEAIEITKFILISHYGGKCIKCGYDKNISALVFHHIDPLKKESTIVRLISRYIKNIPNIIKRLDIIKVECDKCILICANCHAEEHNPNKNLLDIEKRIFEKFEI